MTSKGSTVLGTVVTRLSRVPINLVAEQLGQAVAGAREGVTVIPIVAEEPQRSSSWPVLAGISAVMGVVALVLVAVTVVPGSTINAGWWIALSVATTLGLGAWAWREHGSLGCATEDVLFLKTTPRGLQPMERGERTPNGMPAYGVFTSLYEFSWRYPGILTKTQGKDKKHVVLEIEVCGSARITGTEALVERTHEGIPEALASDWGSAYSAVAAPLCANLESRTYSQLRALGLPGRAGSENSELVREMQASIEGVLAQLRRNNCLYAFEGVRVRAVLPPKDIQDKEAAQEALVAELSGMIQTPDKGEAFWTLPSRIEEVARADYLDAENAERLRGMWEKAAEQEMVCLISTSHDLVGIQSRIERSALSGERAERLRELLEKRRQDLDEGMRQDALARLRNRISECGLGDLPSAEREIADEQAITDDDRAKLHSELQEWRAHLHEERVISFIQARNPDQAESALEHAEVSDEVRAGLGKRIKEEREIQEEERQRAAYDRITTAAANCGNMDALAELRGDAKNANFSAARARSLESSFAAAEHAIKEQEERAKRQEPVFRDLMQRISVADSAEIELHGIRVGNADFVPSFKRTLEGAIAARRKELADEREARKLAEVARRLDEVDVQARTTLAAHDDPEIKKRLDAVAALARDPDTYIQTGIALNASRPNNRPQVSGFLVDAASAGMLPRAMARELAASELMDEPEGEPDANSNGSPRHGNGNGDKSNGDRRQEASR